MLSLDILKGGVSLLGHVLSLSSYFVFFRRRRMVLLRIRIMSHSILGLPQSIILTPPKVSFRCFFVFIVGRMQWADIDFFAVIIVSTINVRWSSYCSDFF